MKGEQADHRSFMLDTIALGPRPYAVEVPAPPRWNRLTVTTRSVAPGLASPCRLSGYGIRPPLSDERRRPYHADADLRTVSCLRRVPHYRA